MNRPRYLSSALARVGVAITLTATVASSLGACGESPDVDETGLGTVEPKPVDSTIESKPVDDDTALARESSEDIDKALDFFDSSLSCVSVPDRTCPDVTLRMANVSMFISDGSGGGFSVPLNPAPPAQEAFHSGSGMRAGINLDSISCRSSGGQQRIFSEELEMRFNTETVLNARSDGTAEVSPPSRALNYPQVGAFSSFSCPNPRIGVLAPGFEPNVVQGTGRFVSFRRVTDAQTLRDGTARFFIRCDTTVNLANIVSSRDRPRDLLSTNGRQFVDGLSLSSSQRQQRCNAMCFDDCAVTFGSDAQGAQNCTDICTPDCVSRAINDTDLCPGGCNECSQSSDCGEPFDVQCSASCCVRIIF